MAAPTAFAFSAGTTVSPAACRGMCAPRTLPARGMFYRPHRVRRRTRAVLPPRCSAERAPPALEEEVDPGAVPGTNLRVLRYPHPLLRAENADVAEDELDPEIKRVAKEMLLVMYASNGVGLAAPQVGVNKRLMVFNAEGSSKAWLQEVVMVNPRIVGSSKATEEELEGCLSFPGMNGKVTRSEWVKVEATRLNGKKFKVKFEGWKARIFQHEYDHLDGVLYIDRLSADERKNVDNRLNELIADYESAPYNGVPAAL